MTKLHAQRRHAKLRAQERYGLSLNRIDLREIAGLIQQGKAVFLRRQSLRVSHWLVEVGGKSARVVYDRKRKTVVTFLPAEPTPDAPTA
jgi:hypothetical protein